MPSSFPAWPRRPPVWTSLALLLSLVVAPVYGLITIRSLPPIQATFLPAYTRAAIWSLLPPIPTFRPNAPYTHKFALPYRRSITIPPPLLYVELQRRIFGGKSLRELFAWSEPQK